MPQNNNPQVKCAKDFAKKFDKSKVIILHIDPEDSKLGYASYGIDESECFRARKIADIAYEAIIESFRDGII